MELAKDGFLIGPESRRQIMLHEQGLVAYDIHVVRWNVFRSSSIADLVENILLGLSKRLEDMVEDGTLGMTGQEIEFNPAIFAVCSSIAGFDTSGFANNMVVDTLAFPKPYRVPFAALVAAGVSTAQAFVGCEIYYEEVEVSSREMGWLRRRTEVIRTS